MKTKFILSSLVLAAAFVGCSNEEFQSVAVNDNQSGMIELSENFMIGGLVENGTESRSHWELATINGKKVLRNIFAPVVNETESNNVFGGTTPVYVNAPSIGLCWIGQSLGTNVYTNYEFIHNGWLAEDVEEAVFNTCPPYDLLTGYVYNELETSLVNTTNEGEEIYDDVETSSLLNKEYDSEVLDAINFNSGVFKTDNKSIFGGRYIAYYPYNPNFIDAGTIPATSKVSFENVELGENGLMSMDLAENTFRYTNVATIDGGAKASGFSFKNLSGVLRISLQNETAQSVNVEKIMLYSAKAGFLKEVGLSASAIAAGKTGTQLYAQTVEKSKTILIDMATPVEVATTEAEIDNNAVYVTALPTTISDLKVLLYDEDASTWAEYTVGNFVIPAGGSKAINLTVDEDDFKAVAYAADSETLEDALLNNGTEDEPLTVKILGDIVLENNVTVKEYVTVEGDKIIIPEGVKLTAADKSTIKSNIDVLGESCCSGSNAYGTLSAQNGSTIDGDVYVYAGEGEGKKPGHLGTYNTNFTVNSTVTVEGQMNVRGETIVKGSLTVAENGTMSVKSNGDINFKGATVKNNGIIEVMKDGKFNMLTATGSSTLAAGRKMTNNGKFIDNVGANVGAATQGMINNGDYICRVDEQTRMAEAYAQKNACNIIEFVGNNGGLQYDLNVAVKHNNKNVDLLVTASGVIFQTTGGVDVTVGNVDVDGELSIATSVVKTNTSDYGFITVAGDINVNEGGMFALGQTVRDMKVNNFYVNKNAVATFANRASSYNGVSMTVAGIVEVKEDGYFEITAASSGNNIALVTCTELVEGGTFFGKPVLK